MKLEQYSQPYFFIWHSAFHFLVWSKTETKSSMFCLILHGIWITFLLTLQKSIVLKYL